MVGRAKAKSAKKTRAKTMRRPLFAPTELRSMRRAREVTSSFHALTRALNDPCVDKAAREAAVRTVRDSGGMEALREAYQAASALTTTRHRTAKWAFSVLTRLDRRPKRGERRLRALEVGAINTDLMSAKFLDVRAIDIKSRHPKLSKLIFLIYRWKRGRTTSCTRAWC